MDDNVTAVLSGAVRHAILTADVLVALRAMPDACIDVAFFDPPYGLGARDPAPEDIAAFVAGGDLNHAGDFMGRDWQIPTIAVWREIARVLKPGAICCFYGGTQTDDLLSLGARMAGLSRADAVALLGHSRLAWVQSQGMPKHGNLGAQVDAAAGAERAVVGTQRLAGRAAQDWSEKGGTYTAAAPSSAGAVKDIDITAPASRFGAAWDGWHAGLAPKYEPLLVFQKPYAKVTAEQIHAATGWDHWHITRRLRKPHHRAAAAERFGVTVPEGGDVQQVTRKALHPGATSWVELRRRAAKDAPWQTLAETPREPFKRWTMHGAVPNLLAHGVGALNIGDTRVEAGQRPHRIAPGSGAGGTFFEGADMGSGFAQGSTTAGRFAPNVVLWHHARCRRAGERTAPGTSIHGAGSIVRRPGVHAAAGGYQEIGSVNPVHGYSAPDGTEIIPASLCLAACADPYCTGEVLHASGGAPPACPECGGDMAWCCAAAMLDQQSGVTKGDKGGASRFFPQVWPGDDAAFCYAAKSPQRERNAGLAPGERNPGICRKPVERFERRQLRQIAPANGVVLIPYCGTGSEVLAALLEGLRVIGIERNPVDAEVARRQATHVLSHGDDWIDRAAVDEPEPEPEEPDDTPPASTKAARSAPVNGAPERREQLYLIL